MARDPPGVHAKGRNPFLQSGLREQFAYAELTVHSCHVTQLLQFRGLRFCSDEDRNVAVGIFPESQEILIRSAALGGVALHPVSASQLEMCQRATCRGTGSFCARLHYLWFDINSGGGTASTDSVDATRNSAFAVFEDGVKGPAFKELRWAQRIVCNTSVTGSEKVSP